MPVLLAAVFRVPVPAALCEVPAMALQPDDFMDVEEASADQPAAEATAEAIMAAAMTFGDLDNMSHARCVQINASWGI